MPKELTGRTQSLDSGRVRARPLVSAVIPTFNRRELVGRAVRSVLDQSLADLECIVVDDGSTDGTMEMLEDLRREAREERLILLGQENRGVSAARNLGLSRARGEYMALLDSDDYWLERKLALQLEYMRKNQLEICQCEEIWIRRGKRVNPMNKHAKPSGRIFERALGMCLVSPSCVMFGNRFWEECGPFDESLPACEDYDLWLRAGLKYDIGLVPELLTVKEGGRSDQLSRRIIGLDLYRIYALVKLIGSGGLDREKRRQAEAELGKKARVYIRGCLKRGRSAEPSRVRELVERTMSRPLFGAGDEKGG